MSFSLQKLTLLSLFFLWSLHSVYSFTYGLPLLATLSGIIIFIAYSMSKFQNPGLYINKLQLTIIYFYCFIFSWSLIELLIVQDPANLKRLIFLFLSIPFIFAIRYIVNVVNFSHLLMFYLLVHSLFLYVQFFVFYLFDYKIDFLEPLIGTNQKTKWDFKFSFFESFIRPAGLFNEPGTYSNFVAPILLLFSRYYKLGKEYRRVFWLSFFSIILTFSIFGLIFSIIILFFLPNISKILKIFVFTIIGFIIGPYFIQRFFYRAENFLLDGTAPGLAYREEFVANIFFYVTNNFHGLFFGSGNLISLIRYKGGYNLPDHDAGLIMYLIHSLGPFFTVFIIFFLLLRCSPLDRYSLGAFTILSISKVPLFSPFAPAILYIIFYNDNKKNK